MVLPLYLACTCTEFTVCSPLPEHPAWMACHFSPYGTGLCNLPPALPKGSMVILNDRVPIGGHDPGTVLEQLRELEFSCLLLDFQRPHVEETTAMVQALTAGLGCPVGVSEIYAGGSDCPVFLPPPPLDTPLVEHLAPWDGREIWLEAALGGLVWQVTEQGAQSHPLPRLPGSGRRDEALFCHYHISPTGDRVDFSLWRDREDLDALLKKAQALGVNRAIGLWQELGPS